jgi:hypothetical protein
MGKTFILGDGSVFNAGDADVSRLRGLGLQEATSQDLKVSALAEKYSSGWYAPVSAALGAVEGGLPGAESAVLGGLDTMNPQAGAAAHDFVQGVEAAHHPSNIAGMVGGMVGVAALTGGTSAAGLAGKAVVQGSFGAAAMHADSMAVEHLQTPEGSEKIAMTLGITAMFGGVFSWGAGAAAKWVGGGVASRAGVALEGKAAAMKESGSLVNNPAVQEHLAELPDREAQTKVAQFVKEFGLGTEAPKVVRKTTNEVVENAGKTMHELKVISTDALSAEVNNNFAVDLQPLLKDTDFAGTVKGPPRAKGPQGPSLEGFESNSLTPEAALPALSKDFTVPKTVGELHELRVGLDNQIIQNPHGVEESLYQRNIKAARALVDQHIKDTLVGNEGINGLAHDLLDRWTTANRQFHAGMLLKDAIKVSQADGKSLLAQLGQRAVAVGGTGAAFQAFGGNPGGVAMGVATYGAGKLMQAAGTGAVGSKAVAGLGKLLLKTDEHIVQTMVGRLTGKTLPKAAAAATAGVMAKLSDYDKASASVQWVSENPTRAAPKMAQAMEAHGLPGQVVDSAIPQQIKNAMYLNSVRPQNPWVGKTVAPNPWVPSLKDQVNAVNNPIWALHNATPERLAAVKATYPLMYQKYAAMVAEEASQRPDLNFHARRWASTITGLPSNPGSDPASISARMVYDHQRQVTQQHQKQAGGGGGGGSIVEASGGQLDRMSSR